MPDPQNVGASRGGFWRKLGGGLVRALPAIEKGAARLAFAAGKKEPLLLMMEQEKMERDQKRQDLLDQVLQARESREAQRFETREQEEARLGRQAETGARLQQQYAKPELIEELLPSGERAFAQISPSERGTLMAKWPAPETLGPQPVFPAQAERGPLDTPEGRLEGVPALPSIDFGKLAPRKPDVSLPRIVAPKEFALPRPDQSVTAFETWRQQNPNAPVSDWLKLEQSVKPPSGAGVYDDEDIESLAESLATGQIQQAQIPLKIRAKVNTRAKQKYGTVLNPKQREAFRAVDDLDRLVGEIEAVSNEVNTSVPGVSLLAGAGKAAAGMAGASASVTQLQAFNATLGQIVHAIGGETGARLSDQDVVRMRSAVPTVYDSEISAKAKIAFLRMMANKARTNLQASVGQAGNVITDGGVQPPSVAPPTSGKKWSRSGWLRANPSGDVAAAEAQARAEKRVVVD